MTSQYRASNSAHYFRKLSSPLAPEPIYLGILMLASNYSSLSEE